MKKSMLVLFSVLLMVSCSKVKYAVEGEVTDERFADGTPVLLTIENGDEPTELNTELQDGQFRFAGTLKEAAPALLTIGGEESKILILEKGTVKVLVSEGADEDVLFRLSGTPQNEELADFDEGEAYLIGMLQQEGADPEAVFDIFYELIYEFTKDHIENLSGQVVLLQYGQLLELDQLDEILGLAPEKSKEKGALLYDLNETVKRMKKVQSGKPYIDFSAETMDGEKVKLSELIGQKDYLLLDFWASWCGPCRRSMPGLKVLEEEHGDKLQIVGVSVDKDKEAWKKAVEELDMTWLQLSDATGEAANLYGVQSIPSTFLINKEGVILGFRLSEEEIVEIIGE